MLEAQDLTKRYSSIPAVEHVNFTINPGEILGYLGPNGSGKSTTVKMLTGLLEPTRGLIRYDGCDIREDMVGYKRQIGYVPEEQQLYSYLSGREYLQLAGRLRSLEERVLDAKINDLLELFGLFSERHSAIASYSKGMRQKILLSAALLHNPAVLILDEPFSGLDVTSAQVLKSLLKELAGQGKLIFYSSHVLEVVEKVCSRVIILHKARVVANDSVARLRELMTLPSLDAIFAQLVQQEDTTRVARDILSVISR
jgi:ABC-2 type transport system ATP-binding protein